MANPYIPIVLSIIPKILSNLDRDPQSPTYGSFDRSHWLLKIRPFSSGTLQQGCLTLSLVYSHDFEGNVYYQNDYIKRWAVASIKFWQKILNKNGTVDEYFKREGSLPSTAFAACAVSEAYKLLKLDDASLLESLSVSADYLSRRPEEFAVNQETAAIFAIYNLYLLTRKDKFLDTVNRRIENLKRIQSQEGFFSEHAGADIGYSTVSLNYLALLYELTKRADIRQICERLVDFISHFVHPDGTLGGAYGSRNTEYFLPAGFEILSRENAVASSIIDKLLKNILRESYLNLAIDDRYLLHFMGPSFAKALSVYYPDKKIISLPYEKKSDTLLEKAGIYIVNRKKYLLIISLKKGGCYKLYAGSKLLMNDLGYKIIRGNRAYCSEFENDSEDYKISGAKVGIKKNFSKRNYLVMGPLYSSLVHLYAFIFRDSLWYFFRMLFIKKHKRSGYSLSRTFILKEDKIVIEDAVCVDSPAQLVKCNNQSIKVIAPSKFFQLSELEDKFVPFSKFIKESCRVKTEIDLNDLSVKTYAEG
ncbi:MAG: hypothetical protein PHF11_05765 [Candidatus Omnitrophica bacterium]|nr:hypothetical protein [Candidatus Omnitrophota bacterium]